jgi:hypothetical protein
MVKDSLLAEPDRLYISPAIEYGKVIAFQQNPGSIVGES